MADDTITETENKQFETNHALLGYYLNLADEVSEELIIRCRELEFVEQMHTT